MFSFVSLSQLYKVKDFKSAYIDFLLFGDRLFCDLLNIASLYEAFPAPEAHCLARRLEIYHTPRNGSWLNVAEIGLSISTQ